MGSQNHNRIDSIKKTVLFITGILALTIFFAHGAFADAGKAVLFYGNGCPHCLKVEQFIQDHELTIEIEEKEIYGNPQNAEEFNKACDERGIALTKRGVPLLCYEDQCILGDAPIITFLEGKIKTAAQENPQTSVVNAAPVETGTPTTAIQNPLQSAIEKTPLEESEQTAQPEENKQTVSEQLTLPILIGAALVDSINPCEFAVLLILMTTILASGSKKRALLSGLAYSVSIYISYFLMGLGLYSVISSMETSNLFMKIIGAVAIVIGVFNLKDYFWYGKFFLMEVPLSWRPKLKEIVRSITGPVSAFFIGFLVSMFLLPCTSGPYVVILGMLGHNETYLQAVMLLALYNLIFILPMLAITAAVYFGMNVEKAEEKRTKHLKTLHLIAGVIMLAMGITLLVSF